MKTTRWDDLKHKNTPERMAEIKQEALAEYDRVGYAALRKAREQTQVELAEKLGITQASVSAIENNSDLLLSTLAKYIRALGGEIEIRAVFPEATFNLEPLPPNDATLLASTRSKRKVAAPTEETPRRTKAAAVGA
jgi:transcriptional regulator with XRE-family HTH domain